MTDEVSAKAGARSLARRIAAEAFYAPLAAHRDGARRVGWESSAAHALRLHAIAEALMPVAEIGSLLDIGCGEGALLQVLRAGDFRGAYRGEDVLAAPIARARDAFADATFEVCDGFAAASPTAEVVVCSGALNTVSGEGVDHDDEVASALNALWARAEGMVAVDLAVADRHPPGVGLARADLAKVWAHARALAPVVVVREDVTPGEALIVLSHSRARAYSRRIPDALTRAEALLADAPEAALALARRIETPVARSIRGRALAALGRGREALAELERAAVAFGAAGDEAARDATQLAQAPVLWRLGDRAGAEALLTLLAERSDEARAHLFELLFARGDRAGATAIVEAIGDAWIRRELAERLAAGR